jgi:leader peptidase (prepilin peptidase)/N-methyltransferase
MENLIRMRWPIEVMVCVFGAVIGSFLNVCIYRLAREESIVWPGSRCPKCSTPIAFYDNLPIISFLFLLGRCRKCRAPISWRYPLVEALNGAGYLLLLRQFGLTWPALIYAVFFSALVVVTFIDLDIQIIPDVISLPGIVIGLAVSHWLPQGLINSLIGCAAGGLFFWLVAEVGARLLKEEAMGGGDIKLIAMVGAFLGWQNVILTIFLASLTGAVVGLSFMALKGWGRRTPIPFGPFLALGALLALFCGTTIWEWYVGLGR